MKILAISGSLRAASINSAFCRVARQLSPAALEVSLFTGIGDLPLFNPDLELNLPSSVRKFRAAVDDSNALIIASPEYAHGISGPMKNALDWLVSFEGFVSKPVALFNCSPRAQYAYASLHEILRTMSANILLEASITLPLLGSCVTEEEMLASLEVSRMIRGALQAIAGTVEGGSVPGPNFPFGCT